MRVDLVADARFEFDKFFRQVDRNIALFAIDGIEFNVNLNPSFPASPRP